MGKIRILPDIIINKIAAGEVVERPASVVKELIENSVDAGATEITVEIENGGKKLIRISDNGSGMSQDDVLLAVERHATSKIKSAEDIEKIITLGFRGEALPSIASVSRMTINTMQAGDEYGTGILIEGGVLKNVKTTGRNTGTDVEVKNIFFNMPARRKFLRTDETEIRFIKSVVYDMAVAVPGLSVALISNGKEMLNLRGSGSRLERTEQIFGTSLTANLMKMNFEFEDFNIEGFLGKPDIARNSPGNQYTIMNGRAIRSKNISKAVLDGYGPSLIRGMYPPFVLYMEADPSRIDVNVHPTKREIRIHRERYVLDVLTENVRKALQKIAAVPDADFIEHRYFDSWQAKPVAVYNPPQEQWQKEIPRSENQKTETFPAQTGMDLESVPPKQTYTDSQVMSADPGKEEYPGPDFWQFKDSYIITSMKEGLIIIDQHAAHERILFEEFLSNFKGKKAASQQLLFPLIIDYSASDYDILQPMLSFLEKIGYGVYEFGERTIKIDAVPSWHSGAESGSIFLEYIDEMRVHGRLTSGYVEKIAAALACRSAIKAGKPMNQEEMQYIVDRLFAAEVPFNCPHGRPTVIRMTLNEIEKRFGR